MPDARHEQRRVVSRVAVGQRAVRAEDAVEARQEPRLDRAPEQAVIRAACISGAAPAW